MANYVNNTIPIIGLSKAYKSIREELYIDTEFDKKLIEELKKSEEDKEVITYLILAFLLRKSKWVGFGYWLVEDRIATTHLRNYKKINPSNFKEDFENTKILIIEDSRKNKTYHNENISNLKLFAYTSIAKKIATYFLISKSISNTQAKLRNTVLQNKSVLSATRDIVPNEITRIYNLVRTQKVVTAKNEFQKKTNTVKIRTGKGLWNKHKWVSYTKSDFPCYGTDGQVVEVGMPFRNGLLGGKVHPGCYCIQVPTK